MSRGFGSRVWGLGFKNGSMNWISPRTFATNHMLMGPRLTEQETRQHACWVAVKNLKLSCHHGYIYSNSYGLPKIIT